jgi:surface antigen
VARARATTTSQIAENGVGLGAAGGGNPYPWGECTWYAKQRRPDIPWFGGGNGNALNWARSAQAAGIPVGSTPVPGAIAVFQPYQYGAYAPYGHVAYVESVNGSKMTISEYNVVGYHQGPSRRTIGWSGVRFIYGGPAGNGPGSPPAPGAGSSPPAAPTIQVVSPDSGSTVSGVVHLVANAGNASGVEWDAYYATDPSNNSTIGWRVIGRDMNGADGFSFDWDTRSIPNQGNGGLGTVNVVAIAVDGSGNLSAARDYHRVNISNSGSSGTTPTPQPQPQPPTSPQVFVHHVSGTCRDGACGLKIRSGPGYSNYGVIRVVPEGGELDVVCQAMGETVSNGYFSSAVWDKLSDGAWATDFYADTPNIGTWSPPIPQC